MSPAAAAMLLLIGLIHIKSSNTEQMFEFCQCRNWWCHTMVLLLYVVSLMHEYDRHVFA
jgi:hypothetical protein